MKINFSHISPEEVKIGAEEIFEEETSYFEILQDDCNIGFYGIYDEGDDVAQISVYINESFRDKITKGLSVECIRFPFSLGFKKILINTELEKMNRFLKKMENIGVKYVTSEEGKIHWFEVNNG